MFAVQKSAMRLDWSVTCAIIGSTQNVRVGADLYKALQKLEEAVRVGRSNSAIKWYCDSCARTVKTVNGRLLKLEMGQVRLMYEMEKLREKMNQEMKELKEELEEKLSGHKDKVKAGGEEPAGSSSKLLPVPLKPEITEALDIEKRKDMVVIRVSRKVWIWMRR